LSYEAKKGVRWGVGVIVCGGVRNGLWIRTHSHAHANLRTSQLFPPSSFELKFRGANLVILISIIIGLPAKCDSLAGIIAARAPSFPFFLLDSFY